MNFFAVAGGIDLITQQAQSALEIGEGWDELWDYIFTELNGPWLTAVYIASVVAAFAFIGFVLKFVTGILTEQWLDSFAHFLWVLALVGLLSNNARAIANLALFVRDFTQNQVQIVYSLNLSGVTVETAIRDILVSSEVKEEIANRLRECEIETGSKQIECLQEVGEQAQELISEAEGRFGALAGLVRFGDKLRRYLASLAENPGSLDESVNEVDQWVAPSYFSSEDKTTTEVIIDEMGLPQAVEARKNTWHVPVVAKVVYHLPNGEQNIKYYRKLILVKAIHPATSIPKANASIYERLTYEWTKQGLQIVGVKNL